MSRPTVVAPIIRPLTSPLSYTIRAAHKFGANDPSFDQLVAGVFADGSQGLAWNPSDLSTLFQDIAGLIPVTTVGQPVRLMLDKSGRGNHVTFNSDAARPFLRLNATTGAYYLETDGVDDGGVTPSINFTGTGKVSVFTGIRKLSDASTGILIELSASGAANPGAFTLSAPNGNGSPSYGWRSRGSVDSIAAALSVSAPRTDAINAYGDISADLCNLLVNGALLGQSTSNQGTGNYGNYPLYLFLRGGSSLPFNGHFYGAVIVGRLTTALETLNISKLFARYAGVTLA